MPFSSFNVVRMLQQVAFSVAHFFSSGRYKKSVAKLPPRPGIESWDYLFRLFKRFWFERLWVVQEVYAAPYIVIQCGYSKAGRLDAEGAAFANTRPDPSSVVAEFKFLPFIAAERVAALSSRNPNVKNLFTLLKKVQDAS